jgi:hypothetical protein
MGLTDAWTLGPPDLPRPRPLTPWREYFPAIDRRLQTRSPNEGPPTEADLQGGYRSGVVIFVPSNVVRVGRVMLNRPPWLGFNDPGRLTVCQLFG